MRKFDENSTYVYSPAEAMSDECIVCTYRSVCERMSIFPHLISIPARVFGFLFWGSALGSRKAELVRCQTDIFRLLEVPLSSSLNFGILVWCYQTCSTYPEIVRKIILNKNVNCKTCNFGHVCVVIGVVSVEHRDGFM